MRLVWAILETRKVNKIIERERDGGLGRCPSVELDQNTYQKQ